MKKITLILLTAISLLLCLSLNAFASDDITVNINNETVVFDQKPIIENERTLVPIRAIAEKMLFDVQWEQDTQKITLENFNTVLTLYVDKASITKKLKHASDTYKDKFTTITIDVPARVIEGRTYVPLRAISELFGATVEWDNDKRAANITYDLTYGDPVTFKDKGIEHLCRIAITLGDLDTTTPNNLDNVAKIEIFQNTLPLYSGPIYEGALKSITTLGVDKELSFSKMVNSIEDIRKFPNLENLYLIGQNVSDLSPITYKSSWSEINVFKNPIFDYSPLTQIQVNHYIYAGYYNYIFSYINNDYTKNSTLSEKEKEKYDLFTNNLIKIFSTMQNVIKENITHDMSRKEKIEVINEWIINNIRYDYNSNFFNGISTFYTTLDGTYYTEGNIIECAVLYGYAICEGYSYVFDMFCDMLEIPSVVIFGSAYNGDWGAHGWNLVELEDGKLYHVDTTWNCAGNKYCLISDDEIQADHIWDETEIELYFKAKKSQVHFFNK